jgi:hypothetical protein
MKKLMAASIGALVSCAALGQDLLQCVNPDVRKGLVFSGIPQMQASIVATLPEAMADFRAPPGFTLVGTNTNASGRSSTVAFKTSADSGTAFAYMVEVLQADGWVMEDPQVPVRSILIFNTQPISGTMCRDSVRRRVAVQELNERRYVSITLSNQPDSRACHAQDPNLAMARRLGPGPLTRAAPTLQLPEGTTGADGSNRPNGSSSSSDGTYEIREWLRIPQSPSTLLGDLGAQMDQQGWAVDTSWSGALSKGGRWTRTDAEGVTYWSTIELVDVGNGVHDFSFRILSSAD